MEPLYAKLYDKYTGLKAKRFGQLDAAHKDQGGKFATCIVAAEELIQHLRKENDVLHDRIEELASLSSSAASDPSMDYQKLLMEEIEKNRRLSEEVDRLQSCDHRGSDVANGKARTPASARDEISLKHGTTGRSSKKRPRSSGNDADGKVSPHALDKVVTTVPRLEKHLYEETASLNAHADAQKPDCCVRAEEISGELMNGHSTSECLFQILIQRALGLNFSVAQAGDICVTVLHESSGYSFTLTWSRNNGEVELTYNVLSFGTLERIAPEWMREVIKFRVSMCPVFFQRIANVTKSRGSCTFR